MIYFDNKKNAYGYKIENPICSIDDEIWANYADTDKWDIVNGVFTDITDTEEYKEKKAAEREADFNKKFFSTSFGYIRRSVTMADGSKKDFLADLLLQIKAGIELGQEVNIITYKLPDFYQEITEDYMISLQEKKLATLAFIAECLSITALDFGY